MSDERRARERSIGAHIDRDEKIAAVFYLIIFVLLIYIGAHFIIKYW